MTSQKSFKPGDLVVCVDDSKSNFTLKKGNTYRVNGTAPEIIFPGYITLEGFSCFSYLNPDRFKLTEETIKPTFKPGDLVVCVDDIDTQGKLEHGKTYKVIKSDSYFTFLEGLRDSNNGYYSGRFELVEEIPKTQFKVGDICSAFGCEGTVKQIATGCTYPVQVALNGEHYHWFTLDGKLSDWHKTPSLFLVSRPKKKMVTKTVEKWINVYPNHAGGFYSDEKNADEYAQQNRIACVKLTGTYEVEVEE